MRTKVSSKRVAVFAFILAAGLSRDLPAQQDTAWRISPARINITVGEARRLQILDDSAHQLNGATWSVDDSSVVVLQRTQTGAVVHALSAGLVRVSATIGHETRYADIRIWPGDLPPGTTRWGIDPIGKELGDISAVPNSQGVDEYALEQTRFDDTYLRANEEDGIQAWTWRLPDDTADADLARGDWLGGAVIGANRSDSYTLYDVGTDGKLRWQRTAQGFRRSLAISADGVVYVLTQSVDKTAADLAAIEQSSGELKFDLPLPSSQVTVSNVESQDDASFVCSSVTRSELLPIVASDVYVNMDGKAYLAFTRESRLYASPACQTGTVIPSAAVSLKGQQSIALWQIHEDGTYRATVLDVAPRDLPGARSAITISPTGALVTDDRNGLLIPVRDLKSSLADDDEATATDVVYRVDPDGNVLYQFALPDSTSRLEDEMVIGKDEVGFATRAGTLFAFQVADGKQMWQWHSNTPAITVFAALANGDCVVQTPTALVEVQDIGNSKEVGQGKFMLDWRGQMFRKHQ